MSFFGDSYSDETRPVTWFGTHPVYMANVIVFVHVGLMVLTTLILAVHYGTSIGISGDPWLRHFVFSAGEVFGNFKLWQLLTYAYVEPASIGFAVQMFFFYQYGPEVEKSLGRRQFLLIYFASIIVVAITLLLFAFVLGVDIRLAGSQNVTWGVFIAAATLYPNAQFFIFNITIKVVVWILLAILSLVCLMFHDWAGLIALWTSSAVGHYGVVLSGWGGQSLWIVEKWEEWRQARHAKKLKLHVVREQQVNDDMDAILDKISREGMSSLTPAEKSALEKARSHLLKRDKKS